MFTRRESNGGMSKARSSSSLIRVVVSALLVSLFLLPCATARLFQAKSQLTGKVAVLLDVKFLLTATAKQNGFLVDTVQLTESDVTGVNLLEIASGKLNSLELLFTGLDGREKGLLTYRFLRYDKPDIATLTRDLDLTPRSMFPHVKSSLENVHFSEPGHIPENLGGAGKAYVCDIKRTVSLMKTSSETDGYMYAVKLETSHFQSQAFDVEGGEFNPDPPTVCRPPSTSHQVVIIAGVGAGGVIVVSLVAVVMVLLSRHSRGKYERLGLDTHLQDPAV